MENNKQAARAFLTMVIAGQIDEAYEKYVDMSGKHHNVYYAAGFANLCEAMKENEKQFPKKQFEIKKIIGEGDMVISHSRLLLGDQEISAVHMFRFRDGKIIEMWDCGQLIPKDCPNSDGAY